MGSMLPYMAAPWIRHGYYKQHLRFSLRLVGFLRRFVFRGGWSGAGLTAGSAAGH